jgi:hypothetical protein
MRKITFCKPLRREAGNGGECSAFLWMRSNPVMACLIEIPVSDQAQRCSEPAPEQPPTLAENARAKLGAQLRTAYGDVEAQPIPPDQVELLLRLRWVERASGQTVT